MRITLIILVLLITACSTTQIHVYTSGIDQHTQQQLLQSLKTNGLNAHQQTIELPPLNEGAYIIDTPSSRAAQINQQIEQILKSLNLPEPESHLFSLGQGISTHRYTKGKHGQYTF